MKAGDDTPLTQTARAHLTVYSETKSAEELASSIGLAPRTMWNKGDIGKRGQPHTTTAIAYESDVPADASPDVHLADIVRQVEPLTARLRAEAESGNIVRLKLAVFEDTDNVTFTLPADLLTHLGSLGVDLEFDVYCV